MRRLLTADIGRKSRFHTHRGEFISLKSFSTFPWNLLMRIFKVKKNGPWIPPEAAKLLKKILISNLGRQGRILELGGGMSTIFFSKYSSSLVTLEENILWAKFIENKILKNCDFVLINLPLERWIELNYFSNLECHLAMIDNGTDAERLYVTKKLSQLYPDMILVLDNSDRITFQNIELEIKNH